MTCIRVILALVVSLGALLSASPAWGVVTHTTTNITDRPSDAVIGKLGYVDSYLSSFTMISPDAFVTTRHQGAYAHAYIGGVQYGVTWLGIGGPAGNSDIMVGRLTQASGDPISLPYVNMYRPSVDGAIANQTIAIGGWGLERGSTLTSVHGDYGYSWSASRPANLTWGMNAITGTGSYTLNDASNNPQYTSNVIKSKFNAVGTGDWVDGEGAPAEYDSGGGWFIKSGGEWKLAALSAYSDHEGEVWYRNKFTGALAPDNLDAIDVTTYQPWVSSLLPEPATMSLLALGAIGLLRRRRNR